MAVREGFIQGGCGSGAAVVETPQRAAAAVVAIRCTCSPQRPVQGSPETRRNSRPTPTAAPTAACRDRSLAAGRPARTSRAAGSPPADEQVVAGQRHHDRPTGGQLDEQVAPRRPSAPRAAVPRPGHGEVRIERPGDLRGPGVDKDVPQGRHRRSLDAEAGRALGDPRARSCAARSPAGTRPGPRPAGQRTGWTTSADGSVRITSGWRAGSIWKRNR